MHGRKRKVDIVKCQVMEHLEGVEEVRYYLQQVQKEIDLTDVGIQLDATVEQNNADFEEEIMSEHPDYQHIDPDQLENESPTPSTIYAKIEIPSDKDLRKATRQLDKHQREVINIGVKYARDIVKARKEGHNYPKAPLLLVHGAAGAEKSTVIKVLAQWMQKNTAKSRR